MLAYMPFVFWEVGLSSAVMPVSLFLFSGRVLYWLIALSMRNKFTCSWVKYLRLFELRCKFEADTSSSTIFVYNDFFDNQNVRISLY